MTEAVLSTNILPSPIRERFNTQKISVKNHEDGVLLVPLKDISTHRGIAKGSGFTTEVLRSYRRDDEVMEDIGMNK